MNEEEVNEMLVCEDKYEVYRLGYKRGRDRGYEVRQQHDKRDEAVLRERIIYLGEQYREAAYVIKQLKEEKKHLQAELDEQLKDKDIDKSLNMVHGIFRRGDT